MCEGQVANDISRSRRSLPRLLKPQVVRICNFRLIESRDNRKGSILLDQDVLKTNVLKLALTDDDPTSSKIRKI
jgi:hypothetical protein